MAERSGKTWTPGELDYLQDRWGSSSIKNIAKKLGRSVTAVKLKANRIGLEDIRLNVNGVTPYQLSKITKHDLTVVLNWLDRYGLPYRVKVTSIKKKYRFINIDRFWEWAEDNRHMIDFSRFGSRALPPEPDWVKEKRQADFERRKLLPKAHPTPWSASEDGRLAFLAKEGTRTYPEISRELQRTQGAIKRRIKDLKLENNVPRLDNHRAYTAEEMETLEKMMLAGHSFPAIAIQLGRSESAVRGKAERMGYRFKNGVPYKEGPV